ncbi:MAG: type II toxin-antitoxin system RelE/ParE family toxin [Janthinobacterium lividum]
MNKDVNDGQVKPVEWLGSSRDDLRDLPSSVQDFFGYALFLAQTGDKHISAKPLKGFSGAGVLEVVHQQDKSAYRAVYTVRFAEAVYVLHVFQKKSKSGISTPAEEMRVVNVRWQEAQRQHADWREDNL